MDNNWNEEEGGEGGEWAEVSDEFITWQLDHATWEDGMIIPPNTFGK